jgi:hypothetical protein
MQPTSRQTRRSRSASVAESRDERQSSLPPTYGILATIPSDGFVEDPESLLRRRGPQARNAAQQQEQATRTGIDALSSCLAHPLENAPPASEHTESSDGEGSDEEDERTAGSRRYDDVDEGYQTGAVTTYETETETELETETEEAGHLEDESGLSAFANVIDGLDYRRMVDPVPAIARESLQIHNPSETNTSPDPGSTPVQSPRPAAARPPPAAPSRGIPTRQHNNPLQRLDTILQRTWGAPFSHSSSTPPTTTTSSTAGEAPTARSQVVPPSPVPTPPPTYSPKRNPVFHPFR